MAQALRPTATNPGARRVAPHGQGPQPPTARPLGMPVQGQLGDGLPPPEGDGLSAVIHLEYITFGHAKLANSHSTLTPVDAMHLFRNDKKTFAL